MANGNDLIQEHGSKIVAGFFTMAGTVLIGMSKWLVGREVKRMESIHADHENRIRAVEKDFATRQDIHELREAMTAQHSKLIDLIVGQRQGGK